MFSFLWRKTPGNKIVKIVIWIVVIILIVFLLFKFVYPSMLYNFPPPFGYNYLQ